MADINYTTLLGLALPETGKLAGTWGNVVNAQLTQLLEDSIAGAATGDVTNNDWVLSTTGDGDPNDARKAVLIVTGTPNQPRTITAPAQSKAYFVINKSDDVVTLKSTGVDGVEVPVDAASIVVWDGDDWRAISGGGGAPLEVMDADFTADLGGNYYLDGDIEVTIPEGSEKGDTVTLMKSVGSVPELSSVDGFITDLGEANSVQYDVGARLVLVFNGTKWEV